MTQTAKTNRRIVLASRPTGAPGPDNFRLEEVAIPELQEGQILLRGEWLSLDPYMRGRMSDAPSYAPPVEIDGVMTGGVVSSVVASRHADFKEGERVMAYTAGRSTPSPTAAASTSCRSTSPIPRMRWVCWACRVTRPMPA